MDHLLDNTQYSYETYILYIGENRTMSRRQLVDISNEAIAYQSGSLFFKELTLAFEKVKKGGSFSSSDLANAGIDSIIRKYTGLNVRTTVTTSIEDNYNAWASPPVIDPNMIFSTVIKRGIQGAQYLENARSTEEALRNAYGSLTGTIDTSKGKVGGLFSKIESEIALGKGLIQYLDADEVAATLLHEIGHLFNYYWILVFTTSSNLAITLASDALNAAKDSKQRLEIIAAYSKVSGVKIPSPEALAKEKRSNDEYQAVLIREAAAQPPRSATGSMIYDMTGDEYLADQFAVMWGSARAYVRGDEKLNNLRGVKYKTGQLNYLFTEATKVAATALSVALPVMGVTVGSAAMILPIIIPVALVLTLFDKTAYDNRYDDPVARIMRVKRSLIQALKDMKLPPNDRVRIGQDIEFIDSVIEGAADRRTFLQVIWTSLTPTRRRQYNQQKFQNELESAVNNNIFAIASKLDQVNQSKGE